MSLLQQNSRKRISLGQDGNALVLLIKFNIIVYILLSFTKILYLLNNSTEESFVAQVISYISVPAQPAVFATRPWTLLIYMFAHFKILELVSSMLWLWGFGYIFQDLTGNRKLIPLYIYGGLAGSVFFLLTVNLIPSLRENVNSIYPLLGAGPSLMALAIAATVLAPRYKIIPRFNIPLWALTVAFILIRVGTVDTSSFGHIIALAAGGLMGYVFVWQLQKGNDWSQWMSDAVDWADDLFRPEKKRIKNPPKSQLFYKASQKPFEKTPHVTQQRVDDLLDKIHHKGYPSLTEEEKEFLKKASREDL
ncbi:MAG: rhomboid family intramembrane serine protease [Bacteroidota bacterium]|nr:rhomboid family intramembrane serine protease [Bacteroidota bacterium]